MIRLPGRGKVADMSKKLLILFFVMILTVFSVMPAYAGTWKKDGQGWWYQTDDGDYYRRGWKWIDHKCYYFDHQGYCWMNGTTPDGWTVDQNGAWIVNGDIQYQ